MVEYQEATLARQQCSKRISTKMNKCVKTQDAVFSMQPVQIYIKRINISSGRYHETGRNEYRNLTLQVAGGLKFERVNELSPMGLGHKTALARSCSNY
jgi:hypothetical protein